MVKEELNLSSKLKDTLQPDETIEWAGKTEPFPLMHPDSKKSLILRWVLSAAAFVIVSAAYVILSMKTAGFNITVELVLLVIFAYVACVPMLDRKKLMKKTSYYVTGQRVLSAIGDNAVYTLGRTGLKVSAVPAEEGCVHLLLGAATALPPKKYLIKALSAVRAADGEAVTGLVLYNVKDTPELRALFHF